MTPLPRHSRAPTAADDLKELYAEVRNIPARDVHMMLEDGRVVAAHGIMFAPFGPTMCGILKRFCHEGFQIQLQSAQDGRWLGEICSHDVHGTDPNDALRKMALHVVACLAAGSEGC